MPHWKHTATRCAMPLCDRTRRKGWTTCALYGHAERGVSLYGLKTGEPRLTELSDDELLDPPAINLGTDSPAL